MTLSSCTTRQNDGGAIWAKRMYDEVILSNSVFDLNDARYGGAIGFNQQVLFHGHRPGHRRRTPRRTPAVDCTQSTPSWSCSSTPRSEATAPEPHRAAGSTVRTWMRRTQPSSCASTWPTTQAPSRAAACTTRAW